MTQTVLIVDDNVVDREAIRRLLGSTYAVFEAETASEGLDIAAMGALDCILLDQRLPDREGIDVVGDISRLGIPVVMLTGQGDQLLAVEAMKRGAADFLTKSRLDRGVLLQTVGSAIERESLRKEISNKQRELAMSEARKAAVMEAALDAIIVMDGRGAIVEFNSAAERLFGYSREHVVGKPLGDLLIPERFRAAHTEGLQRYLTSKEPHVLGRRVEMAALRKDGSEFSAELAVVRNRDEGPPQFTGYVRDISDRIRAARADALQSRVEAVEEANTELEAFSYAVAHDLRAPLRALRAFGSALVDEKILDAQGRHYVERISAAATQMNTLIDALLHLSHTTRGSLTLSNVDLASEAWSIVRRLQASDPDRNVRITIDADLTVRADSRLMSALLENLIGNAWKFTSETAAAHIEVGRSDDGVYVRDNGIGFPQAEAEGLFIPFRRATTQFPGSGIGLATAARIIRRHGGKISAIGEPGVGATFTFQLPTV
ncbi:MAG TPA: PAS domain S-box protein [Kofleriaceae bacterium]